MVPYTFIASRSLYRVATTKGRVAVSPQISSVSALKTYSTTSTMHDNDPELLELEKKRNLAKSQHMTSTPHGHAPMWNEALASESEASIKADKAPESDVDLQAKTVEYIRARHSPDDRIEPTTAAYAREEVMGPLSGAKGKEDLSANIHDLDAHTIQTAEAVNAGKGSVQETVEEVTEIHKEKKTVKKVPSQNPTPSEEAVRADQGEKIIS